MTIEEVMSRIQAWRQAQPGDICHGWNELRAAILALVSEREDAEAEACAGIVDDTVRAVDSADALAAIRARIAARKGGEQP
jgi:hypothetical protein